MPRSQGNMVLRESAGLGGNVNYIDVGFVNSFGFETRGALNYGPDEIIRRAGTNHLTARGELRVGLGPHRTPVVGISAGWPKAPLSRWSASSTQSWCSAATG